MNSLIIPVYKNEKNIPALLNTIEELNRKIFSLEVVFVVDGSPDNSAALLKGMLQGSTLTAQLVVLSRNFGSFSAIRTGLQTARGQYFAVMAADLQEPPELVHLFFQKLVTEEFDVVLAARESRADPFFSKISSIIFWKLYKKFVISEMPEGGVDVFACNQVFRDHLLRLDESHSSLIALLFWMGFRRKVISYKRLQRQEGHSSWTLRKKITYLKDSVFSFTDLPIRILGWIGGLGVSVSLVMGIAVLWAKLGNWVEVPGYAATVILIIFFGAMNLSGLGIIGIYAWRTYENTKKRPLSLIMSRTDFSPRNESYDKRLF